MIEVGTKVVIKVAGTFGINPTHVVVGWSDGYGPYICPISQIDNIQPGQTWVPVTRITEDRVSVRV